MKNKITLLFAISFLFFTACKGDDWKSDYKTFDYDLQGTWVTNETDSRYSGRLKITNDRITITGYGESQTLVPWGDDAERPFKSFTKGTALKGYSEEGHIYIEDAGMLQAGIPYIYWDDNPPPGFSKVEFLRFSFGGRTQTLRKE